MWKWCRACFVEDYILQQCLINYYCINVVFVMFYELAKNQFKFSSSFQKCEVSFEDDTKLFHVFIKHPSSKEFRRHERRKLYGELMNFYHHNMKRGIKVLIEVWRWKLNTIYQVIFTWWKFWLYWRMTKIRHIKMHQLLKVTFWREFTKISGCKNNPTCGILIGGSSCQTWIRDSRLKLDLSVRVLGRMVHVYWLLDPTLC